MAGEEEGRTVSNEPIALGRPKRRIWAFLIGLIALALILDLCLAMATRRGTFLTHLIFPARTGAEGVVLDQYGQPVPNAPMGAHGYAISACWFFFGPFYHYRFQSDAQGRWHTDRNDADRMMIRTYPSPDYDYTPGAADYTMADFIHYGQYQTNVVLRLQKIGQSE